MQIVWFRYAEFKNIKERVHIISSILAKLLHLIKQCIFLLLQLLQTLLNLLVLLYRIVQFRSLLDTLDRLHVINLLLLHCYFFILALEFQESGQDRVLLHLTSKQLQIVISLTINQLLQKLTIQMDQKVRILPHLNAYFLQRKAYEQHRKKIDYIRASGVRSVIRNTENNSPEKVDDNVEGKQVKTALKYSIHTIKEEIKNQLTHKLSPWAKRQRKEHEKQNSRLINRIQKCESTISRKDILRHRLKNEEIKQRISKFVKSPRSHKTLMKCKHSLEILKQKDRSREQSSIILNRINNHQSQSKSLLSNVERYSGSQRQSKQPLMFQKKASLDKFYLLKNRSKIMTHFQKKKSQPNISLMRNYYNSVIQSHKYLRGLGRSNRGKCFTTEIES